MFPARSAGELRGNVGLRVAVVELRVRSWFDAPGNRWPSSAGQATYGKGLHADGDYLPLRGKVTRFSDDGVKITLQLKAIATRSQSAVIPSTGSRGAADGRALEETQHSRLQA